MSRGPHTDARTSRGRLRALAVVLSAAVAGAYLVLFFLVRTAERGEPENTFGAYLFLFIAYAVTAVALAVRDSRAVQMAAAVLQPVVLALFMLFGLAVLGHPGVFDYDPVRHLHMPLWAVGISAAQVLLLAVVVQLAATAPARPTFSPRRS
ncbi:MAG TPA: hypothetical protein VHO27_15490 [Angustibacter sp.]|nr:hypothetical protein [Angustibacter sp.]